jgi:hypothetical protein
LCENGLILLLYFIKLLYFTTFFFLFLSPNAIILCENGLLFFLYFMNLLYFTTFSFYLSPNVYFYHNANTKTLNSHSYWIPICTSC